MASVLSQVCVALAAGCLAWWLWWDRDDVHWRRRNRTPPAQRKRRSVLVIDGGPALGFLEQVLRARGFAVYTTPSPQQALRLCRDTLPEIVLGEVGYSSGREGLATLATLKEFNPDLRYCLLGQGCAGSADELERLGTVISFEAPVTLHQLLGTLDSLAA
jgi:ActR/RegA family two-component response regulator